MSSGSDGSDDDLLILFLEWHKCVRPANRQRVQPECDHWEEQAVEQRAVGRGAGAAEAPRWSQCGARQEETEHGD